MMPRRYRWTGALALLAAIGLGCAEGTDTGAPADVAPTPEVIDATPAPAGDATTPAEGEATTTPTEGAAADVKLSEEEIAQIEKLPAEDQVLALAQKICPASGEPLGSMGVPIKVMAKGEPVFVCCKGCVQEVEENPDTYLAKLGKK